MLQNPWMVVGESYSMMHRGSSADLFVLTTRYVCVFVPMVIREVISLQHRIAAMESSVLVFILAALYPFIR